MIRPFRHPVNTQAHSQVLHIGIFFHGHALQPIDLLLHPDFEFVRILDLPGAVYIVLYAVLDHIIPPAYKIRRRIIQRRPEQSIVQVNEKHPAACSGPFHIGGRLKKIIGSKTDGAFPAVAPAVRQSVRLPPDAAFMIGR